MDEFTGNDPATADAVATSYRNEGPALQEKLGVVPDQAMFQYISKSFGRDEGVGDGVPGLTVVRAGIPLAAPRVKPAATPSRTAR